MLERSVDRLVEGGDTRRAYLSLYAQQMLASRLGRSLSADSVAMQRMQALEQSEWGPLLRRHMPLLLSAAARARGDVAAAMAIAAGAAAACRAAGGQAEAWPFEHTIGQMLAAAGRWAEAAEQMATLLDEVREAGMLRQQMPLLAMAASVHLRDGGSPDAIALARRTIELLQEEAMVWWMADALPWAAWRDQRPEDALRLQAWADGLVKARGDHRGPVYSRMRRELVEACGSEPPPQTEPMDEAQALRLAFGPVPTRR